MSSELQISCGHMESVAKRRREAEKRGRANNLDFSL